MLSKGLTFIPSAKPHTPNELLNDFNSFCSKLRIQVKGTKHTSKDGFDLFHKNQSHTINSRPTRFQNFEGILSEMKQKISELSPENVQIKHNLSLAEKQLSRNLLTTQILSSEMLIKGSTIVVQNRTDYISEGFLHLSDTTTYTLLTGDPTAHLCKEIKSLLTDFKKKGYLTDNMTNPCLRHRISQHISKTNPTCRDKSSAIDTHFSQPGHKMSVQPLAVVPPTHDNIQSRLHSLEILWIDRLKSIYPQGLNWSHGVRA